MEVESLAYEAELRERDQLVAMEALEPVRTAATVRVRHGKVSITDARTQGGAERLDWVVLITARDLNDAIRSASRIPAARLGRVEVWPVRRTEAPRPGARTDARP